MIEVQSVSEVRVWQVAEHGRSYITIEWKDVSPGQFEQLESAVRVQLAELWKSWFGGDPPHLRLICDECEFEMQDGHRTQDAS